MDAWMPLYQTLAWVGFAVLVLLFFGVPVRRIAAAVTRRLNPAGVGTGVDGRWGDELERLQGLQYVEPACPPSDPEPHGPGPVWTDIDETSGCDSRRVHLAHLVTPHPRRPGWFEIFVLLVGDQRERHRLPADLHDVAKAQFFLGRRWQNRVFEVRCSEPRGLIGVRTAGYEPTLCRCRIHFRDGHTAVLSRYLDFEMAAVLAGRRTTD